MKKIFAILVSIIFIGCTTLSTLRPTENNLAGMQQKIPGISLDAAQKGFKLYKFNCAGCHYLHKPDAYTPCGWEKVLPEMLGRAKITSEADAKLIRDYLFAKAK